MKLNLLPRKEFEIILESGEVIKGKFGNWSVKRFTDIKGIPLSKLEEAMNAESISFDDVCLVLLCAVEYSCRKGNTPFKYTDVEACEWIEWLGGLGGEEYSMLMAHAGSEEVEKKNPGQVLSGESSSEFVSVPV